MPKTANEVFRDHVRYTGDGLPNEPTNAPLPGGDPTSGGHNPGKADIREVFQGVYDARDDAEQWADVALSVAGSGTIYTTRSALAAAVTAVPYPDGTIAYVQGRRYRVDPIGPDRLVAIDMDWSGQVDGWKAKMQAGAAVTIGAYGDSIYDGNGTTDWTANPVDGSGDAVGSAAHNPPNAWPAAFRTIIRAMYRNDNISVWNAGYGGKDIVTNWARRNFAQAIINNPAYGTPNICIIGFGLNDIVRGVFTVDAFYAEAKYLLSLCDYYGICPILMTPDPAISPGEPLRRAANIQRIVEVYERLGKECGVEVIDAHDAMTEVFSSSTTNALWAYHQPDGLHFGDVGARVRASYVAARLYTGTLFLDETDNFNVAPWGRSAGTADQTYSVETTVNNRFGACVNITGGSYATGARLMETWFWSMKPGRELFYRGIDGEGYRSPRTMANAPRLEVGDYFNGTTTLFTCQAAGRVVEGAGERTSEGPQHLGRVSAGLTCARLLAPLDTNANIVSCGYFSVRSNSFPRSYMQWMPAAGSGVQVWDSDPYETDPLLCGFGYGRSLRMSLDMRLPDGAGFVLWASRCFPDDNAAVRVRRKALVLYRNGGNLELRQLIYDNVDRTLGASLASGAVSWAETGNEFQVYCAHDGSNGQVFQVVSPANPLSPILTYTRTIAQTPIAYAGRPGAFLKNYATSSVGRASATIFDIDYGG